MANFSLPSPPSSDKMDSPEWRKWFYLLTEYVKITVSGVIDIVTGTSGILPISRGGTGLNTTGAPNQVLGMKASTNELEYKTITAGSNITVVHTAGDITINSTATSTALTLLNEIDVPTTIPIKHSYPVVGYLKINSDLTNYGNIMIL